MNEKAITPQGQASTNKIRLVTWRWVAQLFARELLQELYLGVLDREADPAGYAAYIENPGHMGRASNVIKDLLQSKEFQARSFAQFAPDIARAFHRGILRREARPGGLEAYTLKLSRKENLESVLAGMVESDEFRHRSFAAFSSDLVNGVFKGLLGHGPEREELADLSARLAKEQDIAAILRECVRSEEFQHKSFAALSPELAKAVCQGLFGHEPEPGQLGKLSIRLAKEQDLAAILRECVHSEEFRYKGFAQPAPDMARALYRAILGREADEEGLEVCVHKLTQGGKLDEVLAWMVGSEEFRRKSLATVSPEVVDAMYKGLVGYEPDPEQRANFSTRLAHEQDIAALLRELIQTDEFQCKSFAALAPDMARAFYRAILGREADEKGLEGCLQKLARKENIEGVLAAMVKSEEFRRRSPSTISPDAIYKGILGREPVPAELASLSARLSQEKDIALLLREFVQSEESRRKSFAAFSPALVKALHKGLFGNEPEPAEAAKFSTRLAKDQDLAAILREWIGTEKYRKGSLAPHAPQLIQSAYKGVLKRDADPAGLAKYSEQLSQTGDIAPILTALAASEEFHKNFTRSRTQSSTTLADIQAMKTVFVHIPKTGGTTMHNALLPHFNPIHICPERFNHLDLYYSGELARWRFFSGHFILGSCELIPGPKRAFTMLRHPMDRLVSYYNFSRAHSEKKIKLDNLKEARLARKHPMSEFFQLEEIRRMGGMNNAMVRSLSTIRPAVRSEKDVDIIADAMIMLPNAKENLRSMLTFGILERYQESVELIFEALGLPVPATVAPKMVLKDVMADSNSGLDRMEPQSCDDKAREAMAPLIKADLLLYEYALQLFKKRIAARQRGPEAQPSLVKVEA